MKILVGDIFQSKAQTIINTVNCVGVMGKGIALEFKKRFPEMFQDYLQRCTNKEVRPGVPYIFKTLIPPQIINFPTKEHWKAVSKINDIDRGMDFLLAHYKEWGVTSLAIPPLGCGNGQLEWKVVGALIYKKANQMDIPIELYAPYATNPRELSVEFLEQEATFKQRHSRRAVLPVLNPAWVALVEILRCIEKEPYHWPIGRTIFQKIAYVATREGLPTGFQYERGSFGPFSKELKNAQSKLINNNLLQEERIGQMFRVKVGPGYAVAAKEYSTFPEQWVDIIEKTADLFMRMNTDQSEIVATVIYAMDELKAEKNVPPSEMEVLKSVMEWKQKRRPPLNKVEVASSIRNLGMLHWIDAKPDPTLPVPADDALTS